MTLDDFTEGLVPGIALGFNPPPEQVRQIEAWIAQGLIRTDDPSPHPVDSLWFVAPPKVDTSRWPYKCGQLAKQQGTPRNWHETNGKFDQKHDGGKLVVGSSSQVAWLAGWDSVK